MIRLGIDARTHDHLGGPGRYCRNVLSALLADPADLEYVVWLPDGGDWSSFPVAEGVKLEVRSAPEPGLADARFEADVNAAELDVFCSFASPVPSGVSAPILLVVHGVSPDGAPAGGIVGESVERATSIIADCSLTAVDVERLFPRHAHRVWVVPPGVENRFFEPPDPAAFEAALAAHGLEKEGYVLHVGRSDGRKNLVRLVDAYAGSGLQGRFPLVLAGEPGGADPDLRARLESKDAVAIRRLGYVADEQLPSILRGALLFVFPSLEERSCLALQEAMATGRPVVGSRTDSIAELVGDAGLLIDPLDVAHLRGEMERVVSDASLRESMSAWSAARMRSYTWRRTAERVRRLAEHAASGALKREEGSPLFPLRHSA